MVEVTMYRIVCSEPECEDSPQDDAEFYAWLEPEAANLDAESADWYISKDRQTHYCSEHQPQCPVEDCGAFLRDDEFGEFCADHAPEEAEAADG